MKMYTRIKNMLSSKIFKIVGLVILFFSFTLVICALVFNLICRTAQPNFKPLNEQIPDELNAAEKIIENYKRPEESTYLTFPEWYLVFNPQEYGQFIAKNKPSEFPYFASIGQFWSGYCHVYGITKRNYPFNGGVQLMESVIGTSFTAEYAIKGIWENTIGRISEWLGGSQTEEDVYAAKVAQEYGNFIPTDPWYQFPFAHKLGELWTDTNFFGPHILRKLERKIFLTLEYGTKAIYAGIIKAATHSIYGVADTEIYASVQNAPDDIFQDPRVRKVKSFDNQTYIITVPHYQGFTDTVPLLAQQGVQFIDIAGNDEILLTAIAPRDWSYNLNDGVLLFTMDMMTSETKRLAVQAPAKSLSAIIVELQNQGVKIEHLYDY